MSSSFNAEISPPPHGAPKVETLQVGQRLRILCSAFGLLKDPSAGRGLEMRVLLGISWGRRLYVFEVFQSKLLSLPK